MSDHKPYRPSTGTEGVCFDIAWCDKCARDAKYRAAGENADAELGCPLIANALAFQIDHPQYPKEWVYGDDGNPCCTAFTPELTPDRCDKTADLFEPCP